MNEDKRGWNERKRERFTATSLGRGNAMARVSRGVGGLM